MIKSTGMAIAAAVALAALTPAAQAADIYGGGGAGGLKDPPVYFAPAMWRGFYFGVNGGYGWRDRDDQFSYTACPECNPTYAAYGGFGADGGFGGGQIGYNWQSAFGYSPLVIGIEADIQGSGIDGSGVDSIGDRLKIRLNWFGTVRGRIGYAVDRSLFYFTGGFAYGGLTQRATDSLWDPEAVYKFDDTVTGYVLGGGVEYKVSPSWSLKAEYQYLNFGKNDPKLVTAADAAATATGDGFVVKDDAFHTVRIGLNYHLHQTYEPLK